MCSWLVCYLAGYRQLRASSGLPAKGKVLPPVYHSITMPVQAVKALLLLLSLCSPLVPAPSVPLSQMANMLEGGGKTPLLPPQQLEEMGFKLCAYPLSLLGVSVRAMEMALEGLKTGNIPQPPTMPTFQVPCGVKAGGRN